MRFWTRQFALCTSKLDSLTGLGPSKRLCCRAPIEHADRGSHKGFLIRRWDLITAPDLCVQTFPLQRHFEDTLFLKSLFRVCMEFYIRLRSPAWEQPKFSYWIIVTNVEPYSLLLEVPQRWLPNRNKLFRELFMEQISTTWTWIAVDEWRNPAWYESCDLNHIPLFDDADGDGVVQHRRHLNHLNSKQLLKQFSHWSKVWIKLWILKAFRNSKFKFENVHSFLMISKRFQFENLFSRAPN